MDDKLNGLKFGDVVFFDEMSQFTKDMEDLIQKIEDNQVIFSLGSPIQPACIYCKANQHRHDEYSREYSDGHPFFKGNLEYLEWLDKKRNG